MSLLLVDDTAPLARNNARLPDSSLTLAVQPFEEWPDIFRTNPAGRAENDALMLLTDSADVSANPDLAK